MKNGYSDEGGFIVGGLSSGKSDTEENDDANDVSLDEKLVTPERVWQIKYLLVFLHKKIPSNHISFSVFWSNFLSKHEM